MPCGPIELTLWGGRLKWSPRLSLDEHRLAAPQFDVRQLVRRGVAQLVCRKTQAESMGSSSALTASRTAFVFPISFVHKHDVDAPDGDGFAGFDPSRRIDEVTPYDVPARMIVVRLNGPRPACCPWIPAPVPAADPGVRQVTGREIFAGQCQGAYGAYTG